MKKILLFIDSLGAGGAQRQLVGLSVLLKQQGFDVKVCTYYPHDFYKSYLDENFVQNELIPNAANTKTRILAVRKYFKKENPDWVIAYQETPSLVACVAKVLGGKFKLIVSERNTTQKIGINERIRFFLYRWADVIVPNSYTQGNLLSSKYYHLKPKIKVVTNFVDLEKFVPNHKKRCPNPLIMIAASIWKPKNTINFIKAVSILKRKGCQCKIDWYGISQSISVENAEYLNQCENLLDELNVRDVLSLLPKTTNIQNKYKEADYFCLPSLYEGTPNVICEAMASGLPIICSNVCDNPIYVKQDENGFLFDPLSPEDIASKIEHALSIDDNKYSSYCKKSRDISESLLSEDLFVKRYIEILNK